MNTIKVNIKEIVRTNLINESDRRKHILNSFEKIKDLKNEELLEGYISTSNKLLNEGYSYYEIDNLINEVENPLNMLDGKVDWGGMFKDSLYSGAKEYIIKWLLNAIGMGPQWSTTMSQALADLNPLDLLKPFKNEQSCIQYMPNICDTVLEVLIRYLGSTATGVDRTEYGWKGLGSVGVGNLFGEAISESNIGESISNKLCKVIH